MFAKNKLRSCIKAAMVLGVLGTTNIALAQTNEEQSSENNNSEDVLASENNKSVDVIERVSITGSRVKRASIESTQLLDIIDDSYIKDRGITNAVTAVLDLPGVFAGTSPNIGGNTEANAQALGQNTISLYGLGSQRTLTVINGGRFISSNSPVGGGGAPGSQVDVNNIPVALIDRVEIMKVGGAAIYGADAVAGVVNYILKKDYEGGEFSYDYNYVDGILSDQSFRGLLGGNFDNGRGNLVVSVEYNDTDNIAASSVPTLANDWSGFTPADGQGVPDAEGNIPSNQVRLVPNPRAGILSNSGLITPGPTAVTNLGLGAWNGEFIQFNPDGSGSIVPFDTGDPTGNVVWSSGGDGLNLAEANTAREGAERYNVTVLGNYEVNEYVGLDFTIFANRSDARNQGYQAAAYSSGIFSPGTGSSLRFETDNPFLSASARSDLETRLGGPGSFYLQKGWINLGQRQIINESSVNSFKLDFNGEFDALGSYWSWNVAYQKGISAITSQDEQVNEAKWFAAMDVGINPETNEIDCKFNYIPDYEGNFVVSGFGAESTENLLGPVGTCQPLNPFGTITEAAKDYILYNDQGQSRLEQSIFSAYLTGDLFELPAGFVGAAFGYERRTESGEFRSDGSAELTGLSDDSTSGSFVSEDLYAEIVLPIVSSDMDIPLVRNFTLDASYRDIENSRSGSDSAWAVGLNFQPIEDLMIRANVGETVRAPAITELFLPLVETTEFASDPCDARRLNDGPNPSVRQANCAADGIPADFASEIENASRQGLTGGNIDLKNEQAESKNIGIIYSPRWAQGLDLSVDYIEINLEQAIVEFTVTDILNACYDATDFPNAFCNQFSRLPNGQFPQTRAFQSGYINAAIREFEGYEYAVSYSNDLVDYPFIGDFLTSDAGRLSMNARVFKQKKNVISNTGFDFTDDTGQFNDPDLIGNIQFNYSVGNLFVFLDGNYTARTKRNVEQTEPLQYIDENGLPYTEIPSRITWDLGSTYQLSENTILRASVLNVTDWSPSPKEIAVGRFTFGPTYNIGFTTRF